MNSELFFVVCAAVTAALPVLYPKAFSLEWNNLCATVYKLIYMAAVFFYGQGVYHQLIDSKNASNTEVRNAKIVMLTMQRESLLLSPSDFQIALRSEVTNQATESVESPNGFYIENGKIGDSTEFSFDLIKAPAIIYGEGTNSGGRIVHRYVAQDLLFKDLNNKHLDEFEGKNIEFRIPIEKIENTRGNWRHEVDINIKGHNFFIRLEQEDNGMIRIDLTGLCLKKYTHPEYPKIPQDIPAACRKNL